MLSMNVVNITSADIVNKYSFSAFNCSTEPCYGKKPNGSRFRDFLQSHLNARIGLGGEYSELTSAIILAVMKGFENWSITFPVNVDLDGQSI